MTVKLKLDDAGNAVLSDGKPTYVFPDGKEVVFDYAHTDAAIQRLNGENRSWREKLREAEDRLKLFDGIDDASAAKKALDTIKSIDAKKLIDAGEVEKVRSEAIRALEEKYAPVTKRVSELEAALYQEKIGGSFARSKLISEKFAIPPDLVESRFGSHFKIEDNRIVAYDAQNNRIYSRSKPGELADFDEALETIVAAYPYRDHILKATGASGSGAPPNTGSRAASGAKQMTRSEFEQLNPMAKSKAIADGMKIVDG